MTDVQTSAVSTSIVVDAPADRAFDVFTDDIGSWWPPDHHILQAPLSRMVFEAKEGGDIYDVGTDGSECHWGRVLVWEPPHKLVFGWKVSLQWQIENDIDRVSEVEVRFVPQGAEKTRVELEHRHLDRHGDGWEGMRDAVSSPGGWDRGLERLARRLRGERVSDDA